VSGSRSMHIYKSAWLNHSGQAIYTIQVHPDATRIATGGNGACSWLAWGLSLTHRLARCVSR
jgi:hypothetical protein